MALQVPIHAKCDVKRENKVRLDAGIRSALLFIQGFLQEGPKRPFVFQIVSSSEALHFCAVYSHPAGLNNWTISMKVTYHIVVFKSEFIEAL